MTTLHVTEYRAGFATYPGDCTHIVGETKGPGMYDQWVIAVDAEFDADTDRTRVTFNHLEKRNEEAT